MTVDGAAIADKLRGRVAPRLLPIVEQIGVTTDDREYAALALALVRGLTDDQESPPFADKEHSPVGAGGRPGVSRYRDTCVWAENHNREEGGA